MSGVSGRGAALAIMVATLTGCSLLPEQSTDGAPSVRPASSVSASATSPTGSETPTPSPTEPSIGIPVPTLNVPSAKPTPAEGLRYTTSTISGRSASASWAIKIPVFSGAPVASEVNRRLRAAANDLIARVKREAKDDGGTKRTLSGNGTVVTNDGRTAQVTIIFVDYLAGTAHPSNAVTTTVVDVRRGKPVLLNQVIQNPPEGLRFLRTQVVKVAKKKGESVDQTGLAPKVANWANWQASPAGLTFIFDDYQLGGYGLRQYTVPWSSAKLVLSAYGEKLLT